MMIVEAMATLFGLPTPSPGADAATYAQCVGPEVTRLISLGYKRLLMQHT
jgi:hypothetical protein